MPGYTNYPDEKLNLDGGEPYWTLDYYDQDNPEDVRRGDVAKVRGKANGRLAQIRCESLGRVAC